MSTANQDRLLSKDYVMLMFSSSIHSLMNQFFLVAAPLYISKTGGSTLDAGLLATIYSITALVSRPLAGGISDRIGRVKLLAGGALICALTCALFGFTASLPLLLIIRGFAGIGFGAHSTCAGAAAADVLPKSRLAEGIGYFGLNATAAQAIGPGIALAIIAGDRLSDYQTLFLLIAGLCTAAVVTNSSISYERKRRKLSAAGTPEGSITVQPQNDEAHESPGKLPKTLFGFEYAVFAPGAVILLFQTGLTGIFVFLAPFARWRGFGNPALYYAVSAAGSLLARLVFGKIADRRGSDVLVIPGMAVLAACVALLPSVGSITALILLALPLGLAQGVINPTINSMLFNRCSPARRGTASGAFYAAIDLGFAIGAPLLGALIDMRDFNVMYWASAAFIALSLAVYLLISTDRRYYRKHSKT